jgi:trans-2,3-dihydro-3-hydroxyanthranilate isomerase
MQFYSGEDPATGSAAGCCIAWLVKTGLAASGVKVLIEQGIEMQRPSRITVQATLEGDRVHSVEVSGRTIFVAEGRFFLP